MENNGEDYFDEYLNINFFSIPECKEKDKENNSNNLFFKQPDMKKQNEEINNFSNKTNNINNNFKGNSTFITHDGGNFNNIQLNQDTETGFGNNFTPIVEENEFLNDESDDEPSDNEILNNFILIPIDFESYKLNKLVDNNLIFNLDDYECPVCLHIANDPVICSECEKLICSSCIKSLKNKNKNLNCPSCVQPFIEGSLSRIVKNTLQNIPIICPNNPFDFLSNLNSMNNDANITKLGLNLENDKLKCNKFIIYDQYKKHLEVCSLTMREASCRNCNEIIQTTNKFIELKNHLKSCKFSNDQCEFCLKLILKKKFEKHINKCEQNIKKCKNCNAYLTVKELKNHSIKDCFLEMKGTLTNVIKNFNMELQKNYSILDNIHKIFKINEFNVNTITRKELIHSYFEELDKKEKIDLINDLGFALSKEIEEEKNLSTKVEVKIFNSQTTSFVIEDEISIEENKRMIKDFDSNRDLSDSIKNYADPKRNSLTDFSNEDSIFNPNKIKTLTKNILNDFFSFFFYDESTNQGNDLNKNENKDYSNKQTINLNPDIDHIDTTGQTIYFLDGTRYEGLIVNGKAEGLGTRFYNYKDWDILYKGNFKNNLFNGLGEIYQNNSLIAKGNFKDGLLNGEGMKIYSTGVTYEGNFKNGKEDGYGKIIFNNKIKYTGDFKNGLKDGVGKYHFSRESPYNFYQGQFRNDVLNGGGTLIYKDGSKYNGNFLNGKKNGKGKCQFTSASYYDGEWKNNRMEGFGIMKYSTGRKYIGNFHNCQWNGEGKEFYRNDMTLFEGIYEFGKRKEGKLYDKNGKIQLLKNFKIYDGLK